MATVHDVMPPFELYLPTSLDEAADLLDTYGDDAWVMAGGMDSFDWLKDRIKRTDVVVELSQVAELRGVRETDDGGLEIGAMTTLTEVSEHPAVQRSVRGAGRGRGARGLAADPEPGHARRQRLAGHALPVLPERLDLLPRGRQHLLRGHADGGEPRARDPEREPLRGREPVRHGARARRARRPDGDPPRAAGSASSTPRTTSWARP